MKQNKYEQLFDEFMDITEFNLVKYKTSNNKYNSAVWGVEDRQRANLGDIESCRFISAGDILDRMDSYINDYFITNIEECLDTAGYMIPEYNYYSELVEYARPLLPDNKEDCDIVDMICNHYDEVNLNNCTYREEKIDMENGIQTAEGWATTRYYDDGIARGIQIILDGEIVAMLDVTEADVEKDIAPKARVFVYGNGSDEPTVCENV